VPNGPKLILAGILLSLLAGILAFLFVSPQANAWSNTELKTLRALSLASLPPLAPDKSNRAADDPRAVALGHKLFFDTRFSANGQVSCASCHMPELNFQDARAHGRGIADTRRRTQSIVGTAYQTWFFWDGRRDSLWSQALAPLEHIYEHGGDRAMYARVLAEHYRADYEALFGALPDLKNIPAHAAPFGDDNARAAWDQKSRADQQAISHVYANLGKALAAYERKILPGRARFDEYVRALTAKDAARADAIFSADERAGLKLFIGKANCVKCHNTPLLSDDEFHNTGVPQTDYERDFGRAEGVAENFTDEFKCWSEYSDDAKRDCPTLRYMLAREGAFTGAFKTPSLRKTQFVAPFMHNAVYDTLPAVLEHYNRAPAATVGTSELKPLHLSESELRQLEAFLQTLAAPVNAPSELLHDPFATP
jgi:cytochrome c peroxidase